MVWVFQIEAWNDGATLPTGDSSVTVPPGSAHLCCQLLVNPDEATVDPHGFLHQRGALGRSQPLSRVLKAARAVPCVGLKSGQGQTVRDRGPIS
jgi:hypothetical protein